MKKILLLALLMTSVYQLKAQNFLLIKPSDSLSNNIYKKYFDKKQDTLKSQFFKPFKWNPAPTKHIDNRLAMIESNISPVDHMPIARLHINSNMPVLKTSGYYSKMPVFDPRGNQWPDVSKPFGDNSK